MHCRRVLVDCLSWSRSCDQETARDCLDPVIGAIIQEAHELLEVQNAAAELVAADPDFRLQDSAQDVNVALLGGSSVTVVTPYYLRRPPRRPGRPRGRGRRGKAGNGFYPVLATMGIHYRASPALATEVARLVAMGTVEDARQTLKLRGVKLNHKAIRRLTKQLAQRGLAYRVQMQVRTANGYRGTEAKGKRLFIGTDGGRLRTRVYTKKGRKRKNGRRGFDAPWREPKVIIIYELDKNGRRKVRGGLLRYDATMQDADATFSILAAYLLTIGAHEATEWVIGGDGADWIWDRIDKLVEAVGFDRKKVTQVVDFYHATQHLYQIVDEVKGWTKSQRKKWISGTRRLLRNGRINELIDEITQLCRGRNSKNIRKLIRYFRTHRDRMAYADFRRHRIPIGSGAVESCVRRVVNLPTKGNGIFWEEENVEDVLHLRAQLLSGQWDEYIQAILQPREHWLRSTGTTTHLQAAA